MRSGEMPGGLLAGTTGVEDPSVKRLSAEFASLFAIKMRTAAGRGEVTLFGIAV
jgi:hypothetical protein